LTFSGVTVKIKVIRYICQCRAKEVETLRQTETKKRRNIERYDEDIIELAANLREVHSVIADKWIDNTKTELQKTHKLMDLIVDVENGVISSSKEIPTIQNLATATSTATLCTEPSVSRAPSVTTLGNNASVTLNALESAFTYYTGALWHEFTSEFETDLLIWKQMQHSGCDAHEPIKLGLY